NVRVKVPVQPLDAADVFKESHLSIRRTCGLDEFAAEGGDCDGEDGDSEQKAQHEHRREQPVVKLQVHEPEHHHGELRRREHYQGDNKRRVRQAEVVDGDLEGRDYGQYCADLRVLQRAGVLLYVGSFGNMLILRRPFHASALPVLGESHPATSRRLYQVNESKDHDPDDIDEVPVQPGQLDIEAVLLLDSPLQRHRKERQQDEHAYRDV